MVDLLDIKDLQVTFPPWSDPFVPVKNLSLDLAAGQVLGLVGQSGSGKSLTGLAVMGMIPRPGKITKGQILFQGMDVTRYTPEQYRRIRGREMFLIFQDCGSALTPSLTIGRQLAEIYVHTHGQSWKKGMIQAKKALERVNLEPGISNAYPFELSGGMRQRILVSMAFAIQPRLIIADEPTTGLDMITQAEILDMFAALKDNCRVGILLISHDLRVVGRLADDVAVMYEGSIVDRSPVACLPEQGRHPHSRELIAACQELSYPVKSC